MYSCPPVICPPQYCVHDCFIPRMVPYIHPVVHVMRQNIVNVPQHFYQPMVRNVVFDPGCPGYDPRRVQPQVVETARFTGGRG
ncbi:spore coat protein D [Desulfosporosinus sp. FKB]|uniref:spore coat protein D n=1 Tax=Desulfosporosinus sp. FKB TaxID=1969835 RepID=UPI001A9A651B|nr:spore coat protein D [Desulfosporosinus sp. FKB]